MTDIYALLDVERNAKRALQRRLTKAEHDRDRYARHIKQLQKENGELKMTICRLSRVAARKGWENDGEAQSRRAHGGNASGNLPGDPEAGHK